MKEHLNEPLSALCASYSIACFVWLVRCSGRRVSGADIFGGPACSVGAWHGGVGKRIGVTGGRGNTKTGRKCCGCGLRNRVRACRDVPGRGQSGRRRVHADTAWRMAARLPLITAKRPRQRRQAGCIRTRRATSFPMRRLSAIGRRAYPEPLPGWNWRSASTAN